MSLLSRKLSINNRNKTISKPFVFKSKTFGKFNSQYSVYENEVRFIDCTFEEEIIWGNEYLDEAHAIVDTDIIFHNCTFSKKVLLDGLECKGHIVFHDCIFKYKSENPTDYSLSLSNSKIEVGVELLRCVFKGGINLSATIINRIGCIFDHVVLKNEVSSINFSSGHFAKSLFFQACSVNCHSMDFEYASLEKNGHMCWMGPHKRTVELFDIEETIIKKKWTCYELDLQEYAEIYDIWIHGERSLLIITSDIFSEFDPIAYLLDKHGDYIKEHYVKITQITESSKSNHFEELRINEDYLTPRGTIKYYGCTDNSTYISLFYNGNFNIQRYEDNLVEEMTLSCHEYADFIFEYEYKKDTLSTGYHHGLFKIECENEYGTKFLAIYGTNHFKIYEWNYYNLTTNLSFNSCVAGSTFKMGQTQFVAPIIDISNLNVYSNIEFIDDYIETAQIKAESTISQNFHLKNIDFRVTDFPQETYFPNPSGENTRGIFLKNAKIHNSLFMEDILLHTTKDIKDDCEFVADLSFVDIGKHLNIRTFGFKHGSKHLKLCLDFLNCSQIELNAINWNSITLSLLDTNIKDIKIDKQLPRYERIKMLHQLEILKKESGLIPFLREIENCYASKYDEDKEAEKFWKYRYDLRIKQEHPKAYPIVCWVYRHILCYGLSSSRLLIILIMTMIIFDIIVAGVYHNAWTNSVINGLVVLSPVDFDDDIKKVILVPKPQEFVFSAITVIYRIFSYITLGVLIASYGGFFKGRYK